MARKNKKLPREPHLGRSREPVTSATPIAIFCEGATEAACLKKLRGKWRICAVNVKIVGQVGDPRSVVEVAREHVDTLAPRATKPIVVVVFDRDAHNRWADAMKMAVDNGFVRAVSNPCIELWGLLLHQDQTAPIDRHKAQSQLTKLHNGYHHDKYPYLDIDLVIAGLDAAATRATTLQKRAKAAGDPYGNPTTYFADAIAAMRPKPGR